MNIKVEFSSNDEMKTVSIRMEKYININELTIEPDNNDWKIVIVPNGYTD